MQQYYICQQQDVPEYQTRSFKVSVDNDELDGFVLKQDGQIRAYLNHCPHLGIPLNWQPDDFMSLEQTHIQCATHGALFNLEDGHCVAGPCAGQSLTALNVSIDDDGKVYLVRN
jgi:nitrite reductase/ring-hydroxylating ferredoxin subunit